MCYSVHNKSNKSSCFWALPPGAHHLQPSSSSLEQLHRDVQRPQNDHIPALRANCKWNVGIRQHLSAASGRLSKSLILFYIDAYWRGAMGSNNNILLSFCRPGYLNPLILGPHLSWHLSSLPFFFMSNTLVHALAVLLTFITRFISGSPGAATNPTASYERAGRG